MHRRRHPGLRLPAAAHRKEHAIAALTERRCTLHAAREAVCRCPDCSRFYCRECVSEHAGRLLCAACLARLSAAGNTGGKRRWAWLRATWPVAGLVVAWLFFHALGAVLATVPSSVHEWTSGKP